MAVMPEYLNQKQEFAKRHIGPSDGEIKDMLRELKLESLEDLIRQVVPIQIQNNKPLKLPEPLTEREALDSLKNIFSQNQIFHSYIGQGYYGTITPPVIQRNILENPGWYTQYTPYQAEISQGRLEALLNFQTMISDLTKLEIANASLLDEGTAAAEAMNLSYHVQKTPKNKFFVSETCFPQTLAVIKTRAKPHGIEIIVGDHQKINLDDSFFGALVQYPDTFGETHDYTAFISSCHEKNILVTLAADILSLVLLKSPGEMGADIAIGSTQRFGVPMGFGGPHAAYFATREEFKRQVPGRIVGVSQDAHGKPAVRLALQTREQHIRREKATSNICTSQVLLAIMAAMYAAYHGPQGLQKIAKRICHHTRALALGLSELGFSIQTKNIFDTITLDLQTRSLAEIQKKAHKFNLRYHKNNTISISLDETTTRKNLNDLLAVFSNGKNLELNSFLETSVSFPKEITRTSPFLQNKIFNSYHSETEMLRYLHRLQAKDLSLTHSMIALGSCTMKLNATAEMFPVTWPEVAYMHPFAPKEQTQGYLKLFADLENWLCELTGFAAFSLQPNAGSQGEYAGLLTIHDYHFKQGNTQRKICLIPTSAHGTNPASAVMAGMTVVAVKCDDQGNTDLEDLRAKSEKYKNELAALMITYPSTHGVFEEKIQEICNIVHQNGGLVYMDGANFNAQIGLCKPAEFGPDVCHLNLHKTFCIPHGGGGPGVGPIGVNAKLKPYLPGHTEVVFENHHGGAVSAAPWGSPSILPISWMYIAMMGSDGLKKASQIAILNANYIAKRLASYFPVVYKGRSGFVAHECIIDLRDLKKAGLSVEDVAKRLMDYGFHAPTMSWPVVGTLMIEPTESESKAELDRFCDSMISIAGEIKEISQNPKLKEKNVLKMAPHTAEFVLKTTWDLPYSREQAAFPKEWVKHHKFWPTVGRIDNVGGDRHLICNCSPMEDYLD